MSDFYKHSGCGDATTADVSYPAAATDAVVTYAAQAGDPANNTPAKRHVIGGILASYSAAPTGGRLTVKDGTNLVLDIDVLLGGPVPTILFMPGKRGTLGNALEVRLYSGAGAVVGKLQVLSHWVEG